MNISADQSGFLLNYSFDEEKSIVICFECVDKKLGCTVLDCPAKLLRPLRLDYTLCLPYSTYNNTFEKDSGRYSVEMNLMMGQILQEVSPTLCLVSTRIDECCFQYLKEECNAIGCELEMISNLYYDKVNEISVSQFEDLADNFLISDIISRKVTDARCTVVTMGCIIYLYNNHFFSNSNYAELEMQQPDSEDFGDDITSVVERIVLMDVKNKMLLDSDTFQSLHIFPPPQNIVYNKKVKGNGSFSVLELLDHTSTSYGKALLKSWLSFPLTDIDQIKERYSVVRTLVDVQNNYLIDDLQKSIKGFPDIFVIISQLREGRETLQTWLNLEKFLNKGRALLSIISVLKNSDPNNLIRKFRKGVNSKLLLVLHQLLLGVIDFETSREFKRIIITEQADDRLRDLRVITQYVDKLLVEETKITEDAINCVLTQSQIKNIREVTKDFLSNVTFMPGLGFLISLDIIVEEYFVAFDSLGWEQVCRTDAEIYFKSDRITGLTQKYGHIFTTMADIEIEILYKLKQQMLSDTDMFCVLYEFIGQLDVFQCFALVSKERDYIEPELSETECIIDIKKGRHPLYETFIQNYIANNIEIKGGAFDDVNIARKGSERIQIITGPNSSGKSVYLTQVGLIVYFAQIGCFVPAQHAKIGLVDRILTRIRTQESVSKLQSSFELDSKQMANALVLCTERSLVLIDEFGKGTEVRDGPALFGSIILYLSKMKNCPRTIACTHFHELFHPNALTSDIPGVSFYKTEIIESNNTALSIEDLAEEDTENVGITFLFTVKKGISRNSLGIYCAKLCGLKQEIIDRAIYINHKLENGLSLVDDFRVISEDDISEFKRKQKILISFMKWDLDLESSTCTELLKKKLQNILSEEATPTGMNGIS